MKDTAELTQNVELSNSQESSLVKVSLSNDLSAVAYPHFQLVITIADYRSLRKYSIYMI